MESIYPSWPFVAEKHLCGRTNTVFFPISKVSTKGVPLTEYLDEGNVKIDYVS